MMRLVSLLLGGTLLASACSLDLPTFSGYDVTVRNDTGTDVRLYLEAPGVPAGAAVAQGVSMTPGQKFSDHWRVPTGANDTRRALVKAKTTSGNLVFCHAFVWRELKDAGFAILLTATNDCTE